MAQVFREQRAELQNTFVSIRQKIADAQIAIRNHNSKTRRLEEEKKKADERFDETRTKCTELRNQIADRERDLMDVENQIPLAKSKMHELESMCGENTHFKKLLQQTRQEVEELEKLREVSHLKAKQKAEDCWQANQKLHRLEVRVEEVERRMEFAVRRIIVAQDRIAAVETQTESISRNYRQPSKNEMENNLYEMQLKVNGAKDRRKKVEEKALHLTWETEELEKQISVYRYKMKEMFSGQRELASSKLL